MLLHDTEKISEDKSKDFHPFMWLE